MEVMSTFLALCCLCLAEFSYLFYVSCISCCFNSSHVKHCIINETGRNPNNYTLSLLKVQDFYIV